ncbi:NAD(P)-dependent oxidoreductase [Sphingomonas sp. CL5.1]|uniref:NAD(P)-dependent oxidoreductase n=1 Tax=Sphingomonas sp. CL5.1 TaxID=2653203 RepID=UPI0015835C6C|nr:NAD(P)-dependent oxidoreductase [Sphingomonas sp. CL5.1]QKS01116.1 NAD(P)-dependent oxidoreductase [Sphingomonas sp. CL5.1]
MAGLLDSAIMALAPWRRLSLLRQPTGVAHRAARANLMGMESSASDTGADTSQREIVGQVIAAAGSGLKPMFRTDLTRLALPVSRRQEFSRDAARRLIGWESKVSIAEGIGRVVAWLDRQHN